MNDTTIDDIARIKDLTKRVMRSIRTNTPCTMTEEEFAFLLFNLDDEHLAGHMRTKGERQ